jgi:hypothetical protein
MKAKKPLIIKKVCDIKGRTPTQTASITSRIQEIASTYAKNKLIFMQKQQEKNTTICKDINDFLMQRKSSQGDPRSISRQKVAVFSVEETPSVSKSFIARHSAKSGAKDYFNKKPS